MRSLRAFAGLAAATAAVLATAACTSTGGADPVPTKAIKSGSQHAKTTVTVWSHAHLPNELKAYRAAFDRLHKQVPWLTVKLVPNKDDPSFAKAAAAGNPPDLYISDSPDNVAQFCHNGTVIEMDRLAASGGLKPAKVFPASTLAYTRVGGKQCALPLLSDVYTMYYNSKQFDAAGIGHAPRTLDELTADAKKLTKRRADGSIERIGFLPAISYDNNAAMFNGVYAGAQFYDGKQHTTISSNPNWAKLLRWDKELIDWYGVKNVKKFIADYQQHAEDGGSPFVKGAAAMEFNGEWHVEQLKQYAPKMSYGTAAFPVLSGQNTSSYGASAVTGSVIYVPTKAQHVAEAFFTAQDISTDTTFLNTLADEIANVPSTFDALKKWDYAGDPEHFKPIVAGFENPGSYDMTPTAGGSQVSDIWGNFVSTFELGSATDPKPGLSSTATKVDHANAQAEQ